MAEPEVRYDSRPDARAPRLFERTEHLFFQESAADSRGPELEVVDDTLRQLLGAGDVGNGDATAWLQHAKYLLDDLALSISGNRPLHG
jgi:hypothetical protein